MNLFADNIQRLYGVKGSHWLKSLPEKINTIAVEQRLFSLKSLPNLSYHYMLAGFQGQQPIILKCGCDQENLKKEAITLKPFSGFGIAELLEEGDGWLLMQRAMPGQSLKDYFPQRDKAAITICCDVVRQLHQAPLPNTAFPTIQEWLFLLEKKWEDISPDDLQQAWQLRDHLLTTTEATPVLLHGDLHHENILQQGNGWLTIDPKGVIGEPIFEVATFLRNPIPELIAHPDILMITQRRIRQFADILGCSYQRINQWCFVQAVLAQIWVVEDNLHHHLNCFKRVTELFRACSC